jgi:hypothetical protein
MPKIRITKKLADARAAGAPRPVRTRPVLIGALEVLLPGGVQ